MKKESLQLKLKANIRIVGVLFGLMTILFAYELYMINYASPSLIEIQTNLIFKDYFIITMWVIGLVTMGLSVYYYYVLHRLSNKLQVAILMGTGILLFPFSFILLVTGFMIMTDRPKTKTVGMYVTIFAGVFFLMFYALTLVGFAEHTPIYTEATIYQFEYRSAQEVIVFDMEILHKEGELVKVNLSADTTVRSPELVSPTAEQLTYHLSVNSRVSCYLFSTTDGVTNEESSCTITPESHPNMTLTSLLDFETYTLIIGTYFDGIVLPSEGELTIINEEVMENYYE